MLKALAKLASLSVLALIGVVGLLFYRHQTSAQNRIVELETKNFELRDVIGRLGAERRVADFVVAEQNRDSAGKLHTTLFMVEYDRNGKATPARSFVVVGDRVHVDALVIKFDAQDLEKNDPLRGHSLLLLEKIYGDAQAPADGAAIDVPAQIPRLYRDADPKVSAFEQALWKQFWQLVTDGSLRRQHRVKVAHGMGVFVPPEPGKRYTLTLQADGNPTLYNEPLPEIFDGLVKRPRGL